MEKLTDSFLKNQIENKMNWNGRSSPQNSFEGLLTTRRLLKVAARTALYDGGDKWLAVALSIEAVEIGRQALNLLTDTPEGKILYEDLCGTMVVELIGATLYPEAIRLAEEALDAGRVSEISKVASSRDAAKFWNGEGWGRVRPSERKRRERKKRRWLWRDENTKKPLRRIISFRPTRKTMPYHMRILHQRINERGKKVVSS